ncbi:neprosin family prolyl endopeptidase [Kitasatospora sp. NPDC002227]|uniref:neprosin family prolyl endopeptidase n=1 Tax=Kitasatospora sp. NPDC002227 TaxID=3154773 RepID=UPI00331E1543
MRIGRSILSGTTTLLTALGLLAAAAPAQAAAPLAPRPPATASGTGPVCWYGACYDYVSGRQITDTAGASIRMMQAAPEIKPGDTSSHSLQELALQSADRNSTVEIGWTVDLGLNGDTRPHLFVYHWVNGQESCYNGCGFVSTNRNVKPGMTVGAGSSASYAIQNVGGDWWLYWNNQAIGYFPGSLWSGNYTRAQVVTAFGEIAHATDATCEDMGNGWAAASNRSSWIDSYYLAGSADAPALTVSATSPALYFSAGATATSFHLGGPGSGTC